MSMDAHYRLLLILWLALLVSIFGFFLISRLLTSESKDANPVNILFWILLALGGLTFGLSFFFKQMFLTNAVDKQNTFLVQQGYVIAWALCELTCLCGLLGYIVTHAPHYYALFVIAVIGFLLHMPRRHHLLAASVQDQGGGFKG